MAGRRHSVISSSRDITSFPLKSGPQKNGSIGGSGEIRRPSEVWFGKHEHTSSWILITYFNVSDKVSIIKWKVFIDYDQVSEKLIGKRARGSEPDLTKKGNNLGLQWRFSSHPLRPSRSAQMWYKAARNIEILGSSILSNPRLWLIFDIRMNSLTRIQSECPNYLKTCKPQKIFSFQQYKRRPTT